MRSEVREARKTHQRYGVRRGVLRWLLLAAAVLLCPELAGAGPGPRVAIVRSSRVGPFEEATSAIVETLRRDPLQPEILTFDLDGDAASGTTVLQRVRESQPRLVITVGSLAASAALDAASGIELPVVFSMVLYPEPSGFLARRTPGVTGASLDIPFDRLFDYLRRLLPEARKVGVLYCPEETGAVVKAATEAAPRYGLEIISESVDGPSKALPALNTVMERVDMMWAVADSHVFTAQTTPALLLAALRHRMPLLGLSAGQVRSGALAALLADYADVGRQTAELAARVLHGADPSELPVVAPRRVSLALNLKTAALLGLQITPDLESQAREIVR